LLQVPNFGFELRSIAIGVYAMLLDFASDCLLFRLGAFQRNPGGFERLFQLLDLALILRSIAIGLGTMLLDFACGDLFFRPGARKRAAGRLQLFGKSAALRAEPFVFFFDIGVRLPKPVDLRLEQVVRPRKLIVLGNAIGKLLLMLAAF
jgi:hypothetical protein